MKHPTEQALDQLCTIIQTEPWVLAANPDPWERARIVRHIAHDGGVVYAGWREGHAIAGTGHAGVAEPVIRGVDRDDEGEARYVDSVANLVLHPQSEPIASIQIDAGKLIALLYWAMSPGGGSPRVTLSIEVQSEDDIPLVRLEAPRGDGSARAVLAGMRHEG